MGNTISDSKHVLDSIGLGVKSLGGKKLQYNKRGEYDNITWCYGRMGVIYFTYCSNRKRPLGGAKVRAI